MADGQEHLHAIAKKVNAGEEPRETVRALLSAFGYMRRGATVVREIRRTLTKLGLQTVPDFAYEYIDAPIRFVAISKAVSPDDEAEDSAEVPTTVDASEPTARPTQELAYKVGRLKAANRQRDGDKQINELITVGPDDSFEKAVTIMLSENVDQLVVAQSGQLKGILTWRGIASRLVLGTKSDRVADYMDDAIEVRRSDSLFDVHLAIARAGAAVVRPVKDRRVLGLITATDVSEEFRRLAEPFLLLGEIERHLRALVKDKLSVTVLQEALGPPNGKRAEGEINDVNDLTLGDLKYVLENPQHWQLVSLPIDRATFIHKLEEVRQIRNETMHFYPEDDQRDDSGRVDKLRVFSAFLQQLEVSQRSTLRG